MNKSEFGPKISEPTDEEINKTIEKVKNKYEVFITKEDAAILAKLYKELEWWFVVEKFSRSPKSISIDLAKEIRSYIKKVRGKDVTLDEAQVQAKQAVAVTIPKEKERVAKEIRTVIDKYR